jgi:hypothetical protein
MNIKFIFDIIKSHRDEYLNDYHDNILTDEEYSAKDDALRVLEDTLRDFIKQSNKLNESN